MDSKGRIIIPCQLRDYLRLKEGTPLIIANNESRELRIIPLLDTTVYVETVFLDSVGALSKLIDAVSRRKGEILMSSSKVMERGKVAEWSAIIDASSCNVAKLEEELKKLSIVKRVKMSRNPDISNSK
ncbi:MAG: hypothetical protein HY365_02060 [Candidatus Aenigmarchaeota archaeon]|nr:hypothetical protein [Candidatus Aenigmarchaeota archaeon]